MIVYYYLTRAPFFFSLRELSSFFFFWRSRGPQAQANFFVLGGAEREAQLFSQNKKGRISGYVTHMLRFFGGAKVD